MKNLIVKYSCLTFLFYVSVFQILAQSTAVDLYISKQTGQSTSYSGSYSKSTDRYEHGTATLSAAGPIIYNVTPSSLDISTNSSKSWSGDIKGDVPNGPAPGSSESATLTLDYDVFFSRPSGASTEGVVLSTYDCGGACSIHHSDPPATSGMHQMVEAVGQRSKSFNVISIKIKIDGKPDACQGDSLTYTAITYPSGGSILWSNGKTTSSILIVAGKSNINIWAKYTISGISYTDSFTTNVSVPSGWETGIGVPSFTAWQNQLNKVDNIKNKTKEAITAIPANIEIKGPDFSFSFQKKDCCKDGIVTDDGEKQVSGTISGSISATDVALAPPPWTASFNKNIQRYGYVFEVKVNYGLLLDVAGEFKGSIGYRVNECVPEDCFTGDIGLNFPITLSLKASGYACIKSANAPVRRCKGKNSDGSRCSRTTTNKCGYCSQYNGPNVPLHTSQSWWCFGCPTFNITPASISSNIYGQVTYNKNSCTDGFAAACGIGPVVFTASVGVLGYTLSWSHQIWSGAQLYPRP